MKRFFVSTKESDDLISAAVQHTGQKIGSTINTAISNAHLPTSPTLLLEAQYTLDRHLKNESDPWEIKQSISRGISWLGSHPISDNAILIDVFSKYVFGANAPSGPLDGNEYVRSLFDQVLALLRERVPDYTPSATGYDGLVADILDNWASVWRERVVYEVLSSIVFTKEPYMPFDWFECVTILRAMDGVAWQQWSIA